MHNAFVSVKEAIPGEKWLDYFNRFWPSYERWYLSEGNTARPRYLTCRNALKEYMPELMPTYEKILDISGGRDIVARALSMYCPPAYFSACSQAIWVRGDNPLLIRSYDYHPEHFEGVMLFSQWDKRKVIGMSDCLWGLVDGFNDSGLAISLAFGGRTSTGIGFGIPLILRYALETCDTVEEAVAVLRRVPSHMSYNLSLVDKSGGFATVLVQPELEVTVLKEHAITNHQKKIDWPRHAAATRTVERKQELETRLLDRRTTADSLIASFMRPPLFSNNYSRGFGTLYTAVYRPKEQTMQLLWKNNLWDQSFDHFQEENKLVYYQEFDNLALPLNRLRSIHTK